MKCLRTFPEGREVDFNSHDGGGNRGGDGKV